MCLEQCYKDINKEQYYEIIFNNKIKITTAKEKTTFSGVYAEQFYHVFVILNQ